MSHSGCTLLCVALEVILCNCSTLDVDTQNSPLKTCPIQIGWDFHLFGINTVFVPILPKMQLEPLTLKSCQEKFPFILNDLLLYLLHLLFLDSKAGIPTQTSIGCLYMTADPAALRMCKVLPKLVIITQLGRLGRYQPTDFGCS